MQFHIKIKYLKENKSCSTIFETNIKGTLHLFALFLSFYFTSFKNVSTQGNCK